MYDAFMYDTCAYVHVHHMYGKKRFGMLPKAQAKEMNMHIQGGSGK